MMDPHHDLPAHAHRRLRNEVQRAADRALGRVLPRHDAEIGGTRLDRAEHLVDRRGGLRLGGEAEVLERRALAEGALRPEVGDDDRPLEREARRHDLAEDERHGLAGKRPGIALLDAPQDLRLALGAIRLADLERADGAREPCARVELLEDAFVDAIDRLAQPIELGGIAHADARTGTARIERTPGIWAMRRITSGATLLSRSTSV